MNRITSHVEHIQLQRAARRIYEHVKRQNENSDDPERHDLKPLALKMDVDTFIPPEHLVKGYKLGDDLSVEEQQRIALQLIAPQLQDDILLADALWALVKPSLESVTITVQPNNDAAPYRYTLNLNKDRLEELSGVPYGAPDAPEFSLN